MSRSRQIQRWMWWIIFSFATSLIVFVHGLSIEGIRGAQLVGSAIVIFLTVGVGNGLVIRNHDKKSFQADRIACLKAERFSMGLWKKLSGYERAMFVTLGIGSAFVLLAKVIGGETGVFLSVCGFGTVVEVSFTGMLFWLIFRNQKPNGTQ